MRPVEGALLGVVSVDTTFSEVFHAPKASEMKGRSPSHGERRLPEPSASSWRASNTSPPPGSQYGETMNTENAA